MKMISRTLKLTAIAGFAALLSTSALAGIANTKHNLGSSPNTAANGAPTQLSDSTEICVFCHTPHGGNNAAPLWNKKLSDSGLIAYTSTTLDGTSVLAGSPSLACLSCHDGVQAMDTMVNAPSTTSDYNLATLATPVSAGYGWTGGTNDGIMSDLDNTNNGASLGTDMNNDHPVAIAYAGGGLADGSFVPVDPDFKTPEQQGTGASAVWWLDTDGGTSREKTDIILYSRGGTGYVECASCHDPHTESPQFLRPGDNDGSKVCIACHNK